jgi:hypothetical protein
MLDIAIVASTDLQYNQQWVANNRKFTLVPDSKEGHVFTESDVSEEEHEPVGGEEEHNLVVPTELAAATQPVVRQELGRGEDIHKQAFHIPEHTTRPVLKHPQQQPSEPGKDMELQRLLLHAVEQKQAHVSTESQQTLEALPAFVPKVPDTSLPSPLTASLSLSNPTPSESSRPFSALTVPPPKASSPQPSSQLTTPFPSRAFPSPGLSSASAAPASALPPVAAPVPAPVFAAASSGAAKRQFVSVNCPPGGAEPIPRHRSPKRRHVAYGAGSDASALGRFHSALKASPESLPVSEKTPSTSSMPAAALVPLSKVPDKARLEVVHSCSRGLASTAVSLLLLGTGIGMYATGWFSWGQGNEIDHLRQLLV